MAVDMNDHGAWFSPPASLAGASPDRVDSPHQSGREKVAMAVRARKGVTAASPEHTTL